VDREREIRAFTAREYWTLKAVLVAPNGDTFEADWSGSTARSRRSGTARPPSARIGHSGQLPDRHGRFGQEDEPNSRAAVHHVEPSAGGQRKLGFSPKRDHERRTAAIRGRGDDEGQVGLITYMRTDSVALSSQAWPRRLASSSRGLGRSTRRPRAVPSRRRPATPRRLTRLSGRRRSIRDPDELSKRLGSDEARLYRLIWQRALASQMAAKEMETTSADLVADRERPGVVYELRANATRTTFDGFSRVYTEGHDDLEEELSAVSRRWRRAMRLASSRSTRCSTSPSRRPDTPRPA